MNDRDRLIEQLPGDIAQTLTSEVYAPLFAQAVRLFERIPYGMLMEYLRDGIYVPDPVGWVAEANRLAALSDSEIERYMGG